MTSSGSHGTAALRPRARLLRSFGDELISSESVAVTELVKNSYDADASDVLVRFIGPLNPGKGCIELIDNGHGMSREVLTTAFLEPATPFRRDRKRSQSLGRRVLGEKGIGRFAVSRLADRFVVCTREPKSSVEATLSLAWTDFDDDSKYLDEIPIHWSSSSPPVEFHAGGTFDQLLRVAEKRRHPSYYHGTILRMEGLRHDWKPDDFRVLRNTLSRLISPFSRAIPETFSVHLEFPEEYGEFSGDVSPPAFLANPHYQVSGHVDADGSYTVDVAIQDSEEPLTVTGEVSPRPADRLRCGPFDIEVRVWDRDRDSLAPLVRQRGGTLTNLRRELDAFAGISIYRDGFRVLPYGEPRNDWLRLDLRRVQTPALRLSNNQIMGFITISADENPDLKDQSNREGLIENEALGDLEKAILTILGEVETRRFAKRRSASGGDDSPRGGLFSGLDLDDLRREVRSRAPRDRELHAIVDRRALDIRSRVGEIQDVLARYQRLATLGQLVDTILHDGRAPLAKIRTEVLEGRRALRRRDPVGVRGIRQALEVISTQADALAQLFRKIEPFGGRRRGRPREIPLEGVIRDAVDLLHAEIARHNVKVDMPDTETQVRVDPPEVQSVIYNLVSNSVYWLAAQPSDRERIVEIRVKRLGPSEVEILVSDNGPGIDPAFTDQIFEPYFSTKPRGTGLGLTHAGEIVTDYYDGRLELIAPRLGEGATFRVTLRRRV